MLNGIARRKLETTTFKQETVGRRTAPGADRGADTNGRNKRKSNRTKTGVNMQNGRIQKNPTPYVQTISHSYWVNLSYSERPTDMPQ